MWWSTLTLPYYSHSDERKAMSLTGQNIKWEDLTSHIPESCLLQPRNLRCREVRGLAGPRPTVHVAADLQHHFHLQVQSQCHHLLSGWLLSDCEEDWMNAFQALRRMLSILSVLIDSSWPLLSSSLSKSWFWGKNSSTRQELTSSLKKCLDYWCSLSLWCCNSVKMFLMCMKEMSFTLSVPGNFSFFL